MNLKIYLTVFIILGIFSPSPGFSEKIDWKEYSEGIREAKQKGKKVFLHFRTDWCRYCRDMERYTFKDKLVISYLNRYFIGIKVDGDRNKNIVKTYKNRNNYPDTLFLDERMKKVYRLPGFIPPGKLYFFLKYINSGSYKRMSPFEYYKLQAD